MSGPLERGLFITFEGPDGSGKSTQVRMLGEALREHDPLLLREPGGTKLGERIRDLLLHTPGGMSPEAEMYLYMAARAENIAERIRPALEAGRLVIADRYHDSTRAYQGGGRGLLVVWPPTFPRPDRTILLTVDPEAGLDRRLGAGKGADRLEAESLDFHRAVAAEYDRLAEAEPGRWVRVDAGQPPAEVHRRVLALVTPLLKEAGRSSS